MATTSSEKPLELSVRNFGPIAEADIELRPLSVFVGPSNTGKSYLATLIYALHRFFGPFPVSGLPVTMAKFLQDSMDLSDADINAVCAWDSSDWYQHLIAFSQEEFLHYESDLPAGISGVVRKVLRNSGHLSKNLDNELVRCFGKGQSQGLVRYLSNTGTEFAVSGASTNVGQQMGDFNWDFAINSRGIEIKTTMPESMPVMLKQSYRFPRPLPSMESVAGERSTDARRILAELSSNALNCSVGALGELAHYLPADRAGAVRSHAALTGTLISMATRPVVANQQAAFSGTYGDFLEGIVGLGGSSTKIEGTFDTLADSMERDILRGEIRIDSNLAGYPSFFYRPFDWDIDLPLMNASSMVSELAPVVLYLRHVVRPGETLIIEEPELAIHPAMQVEFTRLLAAAVKAGVRIIITTHSEWVLEELANLVLMSELPVEQRHGFEGADLALSPDEVGAWLFEPDAEIGGTVVKEMPLDKEMGNFPSGFGLVTTDLYNRYTRIANRIEMLTEE